ncbi:MAG: YbhB/YbcL family Raf kinase inhibitor-like protein [Rickettsiales bacterium]|jgi:Raf kinase inhibitor-like YbhB/YbcL family protein|nr:YbhB/YbcL family Raf kinase inhibitor-like protein [Rickettsiales bacterium]
MKFLFLFLFAITSAFAEDVSVPLDANSMLKPTDAAIKKTPKKKKKSTKKEKRLEKKKKQEEENSLINKLSLIKSNKTDSTKEEISTEIEGPVKVHSEEDKAFIKRIRNSGTKFTLYSKEFYKERKIILNSQFYDGFDCEGENISPNLTWWNQPKKTEYFAIIMKDKTNGWYHWVLYNMSQIKENTIPTGMNKNIIGNGLPFGTVVLPNIYGEKNYGGPCITDGKKHEYEITIYAFKEKLDKNIQSPEMLIYFANKKNIGKARISAIYDGKDRRKK